MYRFCWVGSCAGLISRRVLLLPDHVNRSSELKASLNYDGWQGFCSPLLVNMEELSFDRTTRFSVGTVGTT